MGKEFDVKARMREIKADPKRYVGVLERAIKRRDEVIANLQRILDGIVKDRDTGGKDGMKSEYDFSKGVRGKYAARYAEGVTKSSGCHRKTRRKGNKQC